jgi:RNA polymerase sigma-70 factor, ECF subfamily
MAGSTPRYGGYGGTLVSALPIPPSQDADALLVERANAGDKKAFGLLVLKYQRRIQRLIGRMVRDVDLVEDIAQETFIRAYRALHLFRGDAQFYTWLYRIAVNTAKKSLLDLKRNPTVSESFFATDDEDEKKRTNHRRNTGICLCSQGNCCSGKRSS